MTVRDPTLVTARPYRPNPRRGFLPPGRGPATMPAVVGFGKQYLAAVEAEPPRLRPVLPLVKNLSVGTVADVRSEERAMVITKVAQFDDVLFETPRSNLLTISKRTAPDRVIGWANVAVGVLLAGTAGAVAMKAHSELDQRPRETAYELASVTAFASLPFLAVGSYMVLAPETSELLWSNPVR